jgi:hypothetical protein
MEMSPLNFDTVQGGCPYCGEILTFEFDPTMGKNQIFEEDCHVCCKCISVHLQLRTKIHSISGRKIRRLRINLYTEDDSFVRQKDVSEE